MVLGNVVVNFKADIKQFTEDMNRASKISRQYADVPVLHYNASFPHQVKHAHAFAVAGCFVTDDINKEADTHIVSGPHYALNRWKDHPNTIWLDRAFWGDPECVSIGWLQADRTRKFASGTDSRQKPDLSPWKTREDSVLILADYEQDVNEIVLAAYSRFGCVRVRRHPAEQGLKSGESPDVSLASQLALSDVCIGHSSTALFEAIVMGVPVICTDPKNVVAPVSVQDMDAELYRGDRDEWLHDLSYAQFNHDEFGLALELLQQCE